MKVTVLLLTVITALTYFNFADAACGSETLSARYGRQIYNNVGSTPIERCTWTFDSPLSERAVLLLNVQTLKYRSTTNQRGFLTLPNGTRINYNNHKQYLNRCMKFVRKGFRFPRCLSVIQDEVCSATIVEVEDWPPTLSSSMTYRYLNRNRNYVYPVNFVFQYRYLECPNSTTYDPQAMMTNPDQTYFLSTVILACLAGLFLVVAVVALTLLLKKKRVSEQRQPLSATAPIESRKNSVLKSGYENPSQVKTENVTNKNTYLNNVEEKNFGKPDDDNSTYAIIPASGQVVNNVLYHSYENRAKMPTPTAS